jgi:parvulin-like peptidyl-prolyl isomerase
VRKLSVLLLAAALVMISISCKKESESPEEPAAAKEPQRVTVQHILISFKGADPRIDVSRTREEAEELAKTLLERAKQGDDFDALVKEFTNDSHPGIYTMTNLDVEPDRAKNEFPRAGMVKAFGDVSFALEVGETGMTEYDPQASKYGWHIIKRLE